MSLREMSGTPVFGNVRVSVRGGQTRTGGGDTIRVTGGLIEPRGFNNPGGFDYATYLAQSDVYHLVSVKNAEKGSSSSTEGQNVRDPPGPPRVAAVTAGKVNRYHHPSENIITRFKNDGAGACRTDADGE